MVKKLVWTPDLVSRFWSAFAQTELTDLSFGLTGGKKLIEKISKFIPDNACCLDFGAGDGHITSVLLDSGYKVAAYEPNENRVGKVLERTTEEENFLGIITDKDISENENKFDFILSAEVIEHVLDADMPKFLNALQVMLKPGGVLVITTPNNEYLPHHECICPVCEHSYHRWQHVRTFDLDSLEKLMNSLDVTRLFAYKTDFSGGAEMLEDWRKLDRHRNRFKIFGLFYLPIAYYLDNYRNINKQPDMIAEGAEVTLIFIGRKNT